MGAYGSDRAFSDRMIPQIKALVGPHLLDVAPLELDLKQATDLIIFRARDVRIAARVRRAGFAARYPYEFTLRCHRDSGAETELAKISKGWGDWLFYGHAADEWGCGIAPWWLIDLAAFRSALIRLPDRRRLVMGTKSNGDGTAFAYFDIRSFPADPPLLVASSAPLTSPSPADLPLFARAAE